MALSASPVFGPARNEGGGGSLVTGEQAAMTSWIEAFAVVDARQFAAASQRWQDGSLRPELD